MARRAKTPRKFGSKAERIPGWIGWIGLALYVAGWDLHPWTITLSSGFAHHDPNGDKPQTGLKAPHGHPVTNLLAIYVLAHLMRLLPLKYDILRSPNSPLVKLQRKITAP
jgi:hypothetical protein